jgi:hypothetical protein
MDTTNKTNINIETEVSTTTKRKKLVVNWPKGKFTISDLEKQHPSAVPITLRFRVKKALESGLIKQAGKIEGELGRPALLFETTNS